MVVSPVEFTTTHWSVVLAATNPAAPDRRGAMAHLCETYWYPLYAYVRRRGNSAHEAEELTQEFFVRLIEKEFIRNTAPQKGRFRAFLLVCMKHFLANEWDRVRAEKRGGRKLTHSIDFQDADERYGREPAHELTAERIFERRWALLLLEQALAQLASEMTASGKGDVFENLKGYLLAEADTPPHERTAREAGLSPGAVKVRVHRLRRRYRQILRERVAMTLSDPDEVDDEIRRLFSALGA